MRRLAITAWVALVAASPLPLHADAEQARAGIRAQLASPGPGLEAVSGDEATREVLARGYALWTQRFANGRTLAGCFPNGGRRLATAHPRFDTKLARVITLETAINQCLKAHREPLLDPADPATMGAVTAYVRYLAAGHPLSVRVESEAAEAAFESGRQFFFVRQGRSDQSCASCHIESVSRAPGDGEPTPATRLAISWPTVRDGAALTLQVRTRECLDTRMGAAAPEAESEPLVNLDYFLSFLASGNALVPNPTPNPDRPRGSGGKPR